MFTGSERGFILYCYDVYTLVLLLIERQTLTLGEILGVIVKCGIYFIASLIYGVVHILLLCNQFLPLKAILRHHGLNLF